MKVVPAACRLPPAACRLPPAACRLLPPPSAVRRPPSSAAVVRAERLGRSAARWQVIRADITAAQTGFETLLAVTAGQVLATLPGVATTRAASFAAFSMPIDQFPSAEHLGLGL